MELGINSTPSVQPNEVENFIKEGCVLVDVREIDEWTSGHHVNAIHIPMGEIMAVSYTHLTLPTTPYV